MPDWARFPLLARPLQHLFRNPEREARVFERHFTAVSVRGVVARAWKPVRCCYQRERVEDAARRIAPSAARAALRFGVPRRLLSSTAARAVLSSCLLTEGARDALSCVSQIVTPGETLLPLPRSG
ncbi:hypothetical protein HPB50_009557 [Hyalomma asiaticum]|uniref:Uncharacterized protein n=1 Tax=Hyalomma asiaticum TaxID=266040 RepID=A0ACB7TDQ0_HYAAI|nr:hypothetical protein HPB50_009557 [Hyalomma asiaticum]